MTSVAIIGAGITGLTAAFYLQRKGIPVTVYEASGRVSGFPDDLGPLFGCQFIRPRIAALLSFLDDYGR